MLSRFPQDLQWGLFPLSWLYKETDGEYNLNPVRNWIFEPQSGKLKVFPLMIQVIRLRGLS